MLCHLHLLLSLCDFNEKACKPIQCECKKRVVVSMKNIFKALETSDKAESHIQKKKIAIEQATVVMREVIKH